MSRCSEGCRQSKVFPVSRFSAAYRRLLLVATGVRSSPAAVLRDNTQPSRS